jgi:hypothetical protein
LLGQQKKEDWVTIVKIRAPAKIAAISQIDAISKILKILNVRKKFRNMALRVLAAKNARCAFTAHS